MKSYSTWLVGLGVLLLTSVAGISRADPDPCAPPKATAGVAVLEPQAFAARIDQLIAARWSTTGVKPSAPSADTEFLRRIYLDLAGRIPPVSEVDSFLKDTASDKRQRLVEKLLESPMYVKHFTDVWRSLLLPQANNQQVQGLVPGFEAWLRERLRQNTPYNLMVQELLTVTAGMAMQQGPRRGMNQAEATPIAFYQANELKPENLAASTSRLFLGIKLECAQCHNHPMANWTRQQFWEFAAFFSGIQARQEIADSRMIKIPGTEKVVLAHFLDGTEPRWQSGLQPRNALATWITMTDNPYFARAAANRLWGHFFGVGLVDPVDEMGEENPPSHPELLDALARQLAGHRYDLKYLIRAITSTQAYQRSSTGPSSQEDDPHLFTRMAVRGLTPEQLFDSLVMATGYRELPMRNTPFGPDPLASPRALFLAKFASQEKRTEFHTSILQALALMNGKFIGDATSVERSETLAAVVDSPFNDTTAKRIDVLYMSALGRMPRAEETARMVKYVNSGGPRKSDQAALADVFWALLNSAEFMLNH